MNSVRQALVEEAFGDYNEKEFMDIRNFEEVFEWIENVLVEGLYPEGKYNDGKFEPDEVGAVAFGNRIVGGIRLRTVRSMANLGCPDYELNKQKYARNNGSIVELRFVPDCYFPLSKDNEETRPYGPAVPYVAEHGACEGIPAPPPPPDIFLKYYGLPPTNAKLDAMAVRKLCRAFTYQDAATTKEKVLATRIASYPGGGYVRDIFNPVSCRQRPATSESPNENGVCERGDEARTDLLLAIDQLKNNLWLDAATRAMFVKITFYNGNLDYYMAMTFVFEFTLGGTIIPSTRLALLNQVMWDTETEKNLPATITEFATYFFVGAYFVQQTSIYVAIMRKTSSFTAYFYDIWNVLEFTVLAGFSFSLYTRLNLFSQLKPPEVIFEPDFHDLSSIGMLYMSSFYIDSICVIALFFKSFKYFALYEETSMLWNVLLRSAVDIAYFLVMLLILVASFSMMAQQFFGTNDKGYSDVIQSVVSLLLVLLGQYDLKGMQQAGGALGTVFFFLFILSMSIIMLNIFLAILGEAYSVVRAAADERAKTRVKVKSRGLMGYVKLLRVIIRVKLANRRAAKLSKVGGAKKGKPGPPAGGPAGSGTRAIARIEPTNGARNGTKKHVTISA